MATTSMKSKKTKDEPAPAPAEEKVKPDPEGDIDQRMAALLKDHQRMGARPK